MFEPFQHCLIDQQGRTITILHSMSFGSLSKDLGFSLPQFHPCNPHKSPAPRTTLHFFCPFSLVLFPIKEGPACYRSPWRPENSQPPIYRLEMSSINSFSRLWWVLRQIEFFRFSKATNIRERKLWFQTSYTLLKKGQCIAPWRWCWVNTYSDPE